MAARPPADARELGRRAARQLLSQGERTSPLALAAQAGVAIEERRAPPPAQAGLRSEYQPRPPRIVLYREPLSRLAAVLRARPGRAPSEAELVALHIAHELCHHLEADGRFGRLTRQESETAAHAFAAELCGLWWRCPCCPLPLHQPAS